jgi:hypothetical protein
VVPGLGGELRRVLMDLVERDPTVQAWLTEPEQVQVGTVQQQDVRHDGSFPPGYASILAPKVAKVRLSAPI